MASKIYKNRDGAVGYLRATGIPRDKYGNYLNKLADGSYSILLTDAGEPIDRVTKVLQPAAEVAKPGLSKRATSILAKKVIDPTAPVKKLVHNSKEGDKTARGLGIGAFCREQITLGASNLEILTLVRNKFPDAKTSGASIAWYRNQMKQEAA